LSINDDAAAAHARCGRSEPRQIALRDLAKTLLLPSIRRNHQVTRETLHQPPGAEIVKVAVFARSLWDNLSLLDLRDDSCRSVFIGMGPSGLPTRLLPAHFGSQWAYAGVRDPAQGPFDLAPGQAVVLWVTETGATFYGSADEAHPASRCLQFGSAFRPPRPALLPTPRGDFTI
jgi:hypothetical protein